MIDVDARLRLCGAGLTGRGYLEMTGIIERVGRSAG